MSTYITGDYVKYKGKKKKVLRNYHDGDLMLQGVEGLIEEDDVELWVQKPKIKPIAKDAISLMKKTFLQVKLKLPMGVTLNDTEANYIIDGWENQKSIVQTKQNDLATVSSKIERHIAQTSKDINEAMKITKEAKRYYEASKDPLVKMKWARKLVVRSAYYEQVRNSHHSMNASIERVKDAIDDAQYVWKTLESRISEAKIYRELNGGLHLVGKSLMEARTKHMLPEVEYQNLEVTMESIEKGVSQKGDDQLLLEAESILNDSSRWVESPKK